MNTESELVLAIDQGTSATKAIVMDVAGRVIARASVPVAQSHPRPGWVEQDPNELYQSVLSAMARVMRGVTGTVVSIGVSSQRESAVAWERSTGLPQGPMLGWQDRRTSGEAQRLKQEGVGATVRAVTGLPVDPMFSALKFAWLLDDVDPDRRRSRAGEIVVGTVDSWLLACLTGEHRIEVGNASRTQLLSLATAQWDDDMLALFGVPRQALPEVVSSVSSSAPVDGVIGVPPGARVTGVLGDSHAALYGHGVREPGRVKATYGTGSSIMGLMSGARTALSGPVATIAWGTDALTYAFEANILSSGSTVAWLANVLGVDPASIAMLAEAATDSDVFFVPAFAGLGAPWWDDAAEAVIVGLDLGSGRADLARAALESIPLQIEDALAAAERETGADIDTILADGGPSANGWLMQRQADISQRRVVASAVAELSAVGVAHLAGTTVGMFDDSRLADSPHDGTVYQPQWISQVADARRHAWTAAVARSRSTSHSPDPAATALTR